MRLPFLKQKDNYMFYVLLSILLGILLFIIFAKFLLGILVGIAVGIPIGASLKEIETKRRKGKVNIESTFTENKKDTHVKEKEN